MGNIAEVIRNLEDMRFIELGDKSQIESAQKTLGVKFAEDYKEYVYNYGVISAKSVELTGVTKVERLDVVKVTQYEREMNKFMPSNMYVIENIAIEGLVALQDESGKVYTIASNEKPKYYCESLEEYIKRVVS